MLSSPASARHAEQQNRPEQRARRRRWSSTASARCRQLLMRTTKNPVPPNQSRQSRALQCGRGRQEAELPQDRTQTPASFGLPQAWAVVSPTGNFLSDSTKQAGDPKSDRPVQASTEGEKQQPVLCKCGRWALGRGLGPCQGGGLACPGEQSGRVREVDRVTMGE